MLPSRGEKQVLLFHRDEVLAIDPDEIDRAILIFSGSLFRHHLGNSARGIVELDLNDRDIMALLHLRAHPFDIGVDVFRAAPGIEVNSLARGCLFDLRPVAHVGFSCCGIQTAAPGYDAGRQKLFRQTHVVLFSPVRIGRSRFAQTPSSII
nr:hypothetical protein [Marinicella sp. W31]MDC2878989.1 hypothetical protein [Marinicella sp. W31]